MFVGFINVLRFTVGAVLLLNVLRRYETFSIARQPNRPTIVVEGVNSSLVVLAWRFSLKTNESIRVVHFNRQRPGESLTRIATKRGSRPFAYASNEFKAKYNARSFSSSDVTLLLLDVNNNEEYTYTARVSYSDGTRLHYTSWRTDVLVYVPPNITLNPSSKADIEVGQNLTLTCNASGDPLPTITWTKDGIPQSQFNVSGYDLNLSDVHSKDVGSYRCTAYNGYGKDASTASIVGLNCSNCRSERVNISLRSEQWNETLSNSETNEFKMLERILVLTILEVYARNYGKQLYRVIVEKFSPGSVVATVKMSFGRSTCEPLKPLQDEIAGKTLGQFTVDPRLYVFPQVETPSILPSTTSETPMKTPEKFDAGAEWKKQRFMFHAIYLAAIFLLVVVNMFLLILLWRRRKVKGSVKGNGSWYKKHENYELKDTEDQGETVQETVEHKRKSRDFQSQNTELTLTQLSSRGDMSLDTGQQSIYDACEVMPTNATKTDWEFNREHVNIIKKIGKGAFSQVAKAEAWNINGIKGQTTVAVKMLKENASDSDRKDLLSELELMKNLKPHPHVIRLMGCVTESDPLLVLIEYIPYGDLLGFLRRSRGLNDTYYKDPDVKPRTNLTSEQMVQFALQIADGMNYLSSNKIIHRDLAARNILVGEGEKCKVTDFGMARNVQQDNIYTKHSRGRLPVKWTAYEALLYGTYTTQSDVWSFGVVLYEIFTVGGSPYPGINGYEIARKLKQGYRMPKPQHVDYNLYQIMLQCWQQEPNDRPTFSTLKNKITNMMQNNNEIYINLQELDTINYGYIDDLLE